MNFQQLKFVREALRQDFNLTEVGNALYMSQSGVSKRIKELEVELGMDIFVRRGKRVVGLTPQGQEAIGYIERILSETDGLKQFAARRRETALTE